MPSKSGATSPQVKTCVCFECRFSSGQFLSIKAVIDRRPAGRDLHYAEVDYYHGIGPWYGQFRWNIKRKVWLAAALLSALLPRPGCPPVSHGRRS